SDMCVALAAIDALVHLQGPDGARTIKLTDLHRLPGDTPERETELRTGELITAVELPTIPFAANSIYRKVRDRASYAFALVSLAAALEVERGTVKNVRLALGGVAHKPWRASQAEAALQGAPATEENFARAADAELESAVGLRDNAFKIELARRVMVHALRELSVVGT
ncbi:MAG TPA: FAD binding domain-containing protein, partial [Steroidobacteraceae bacterium]